MPNLVDRKIQEFKFTVSALPHHPLHAAFPAPTRKHKTN